MIRTSGEPLDMPIIALGDVVKIVRGRQSLRNAMGLVLKPVDGASFLNLELEDGTKVTVNHWDVEKA